MPVSPSAGLGPAEGGCAVRACARCHSACASWHAGLRRRLTEHPHGTPHRLVSVALILTSRWAAVSCYAALCSPDLPPVPGFPDRTSGGLAGFTGWIVPPWQSALLFVRGACEPTRAWQRLRHRTFADSSQVGAEEAAAGAQGWNQARLPRSGPSPRAALGPLPKFLPRHDFVRTEPFDRLRTGLSKPLPQHCLPLIHRRGFRSESPPCLLQRAVRAGAVA